MDKMLAGIRSNNIQLESQSQLTMTTQNIEVYSNQEISKFENEVQNMEGKNRRLRDILTTMGITVMGTETGAVTIVENK